MKKARFYNTRQREIILDFFKTHADLCFSAKDLIGNPEVPVGAATVFRSLARLAEEGWLKKYIGDGGAAEYRYSRGVECRRHFHLMCLQCGKTEHIDCKLMKDMSEHIRDDHDFTVDSSKTVLYGICKRCAH